MSYNKENNNDGFTVVKNKQRKQINKPGKTIIVKSKSDDDIDDSIFKNIENVTEITKSKDNKSVFIIFSNIKDSIKGLQKLRTDFKNYNSKYSYYRIYFTINDLEDSTDYNDLKKKFITHVESLCNSNILYCKFYKKDNKYINCGDFTIDTYEGLNKLLDKDNGIKEYTLSLIHI
jgi:hypothetical protein